MSIHEPEHFDRRDATSPGWPSPWPDATQRELHESLFKSDPNDTNPHYPGSAAWLDPGLRAIHRPWEELHYTPQEPQLGEHQLPMWAFYLIALPVIGAILSTDPETSVFIRWGWFPALILAALFIGWRLLRSDD